MSTGNEINEQNVAPDERDRPNAMLLWLWWFVFSPVVLFLAPSYAKKAKRLGFKETGRYWVPFWLTVVGYALAVAAVIVVVIGIRSSSDAIYSSTPAPATSAVTSAQSTSPLDSHSSVQEDRFPPVIPLANDPQSRQLEALILADGNDQYYSSSNAHCVKDTTIPAQARPETDVSGVVSVWNCDIDRSPFGAPQKPQTDSYEYAVVWNGGTNPPAIQATDPPGDWRMYERSN